MKIRYVTLLAAIAGLMAACGNDRKGQDFCSDQVSDVLIDFA